MTRADSTTTGSVRWGVLSLPSGNFIAWTDDSGERDEWLAEMRRGEWGDCGLAGFDDDGNVERLWPPEDGS